MIIILEFKNTNIQNSDFFDLFLLLRGGMVRFFSSAKHNTPGGHNSSAIADGSVTRNRASLRRAAGWPAGQQ